MKIMRKKRQNIKVEHNKKVFWLIIILLGLLIVLVLYIRIKDAEKSIGGEKDEHGCYLMAGYSWCEVKQKCLRTWEEPCTGECSIDSDCTEAECCHAVSCVHKSEKPNCSNIVCITECSPETLDCGQGECKCIDNKCAGVIE